MKVTIINVCLAVGIAVLSSLGAAFAAEKANKAAIYPVALLPFEDRDAEGGGVATKVADLLFANLAGDSALFLVDRQDLGKVLDEQTLSRSGMVAPDEANRIGHLTGAKILVTGSVFHTEGKRYLVAKVIGTETSRVVGAIVQGDSTRDLDVLVEELAGVVVKTISNHAKKLVAPPVSSTDRLTALRKRLKNSRRPTLTIEVDERHLGQPTIDPAAETELMRICRELGFDIVDSADGAKDDADVRITGEAFSEFAARQGDLVSVKSRLEVKAVERSSGRVLAVDRQVNVAVDLAEQITAKTALEEAAAGIAERVLPEICQSLGGKTKGKR